MQFDLATTRANHSSNRTDDRDPVSEKPRLRLGSRIPQLHVRRSLLIQAPISGIHQLNRLHRNTTIMTGDLIFIHISIR